MVVEITVIMRDLFLGQQKLKKRRGRTTAHEKAVDQNSVGRTR